MKVKDFVCMCAGVVGGVVNWLFGGYTIAMECLVICMAIDYICGLVVAGLFHKSKKSEKGGLSSKEGWKGLARKCLTLGLLVIAYRLDCIIGKAYVKDTLTIAFIVNECLSIIENAGLMGLPMPKVLTNAIDILNKKVNGEDKTTDTSN